MRRSEPDAHADAGMLLVDPRPRGDGLVLGASDDRHDLVLRSDGRATDPSDTRSISSSVGSRSLGRLSERRLRSGWSV